MCIRITVLELCTNITFWKTPVEILLQNGIQRKSAKYDCYRLNYITKHPGKVAKPLLLHRPPRTSPRPRDHLFWGQVSPPV